MTYKRITHAEWIPLHIEIELRTEYYTSPNSLIKTFGEPTYDPYPGQSKIGGMYVFLSENGQEVWTVYDMGQTSVTGYDDLPRPELFWHSDGMGHLHIAGPKSADLDRFMLWLVARTDGEPHPELTWNSRLITRQIACYVPKSRKTYELAVARALMSNDTEAYCDVDRLRHQMTSQIKVNGENGFFHGKESYQELLDMCEQLRSMNITHVMVMAVVEAKQE